jgi:hypothetical protein
VSGNDARFTMEAFLALTGHPVCKDPAAAHSNALLHDPRYKQQLEASIQAAAEQGWGAPFPVQPPPKRGRAPQSVGSGSANGSAGTSPAAPQAVGAGGWNSPASAPGQAAAWAKPAAAAAAAPAQASAAGAWGRGPPAAAAAAGGRGGGAWGGPAQQAAPPAQQQQHRLKNNNPYLPNNKYEPSEDSW